MVYIMRLLIGLGCVSLLLLAVALGGLVISRKQHDTGLTVWNLCAFLLVAYVLGFVVYH
jgi:hypothetical protein